MEKHRCAGCCCRGATLARRADVVDRLLGLPRQRPLVEHLAGWDALVPHSREYEFGIFRRRRGSLRQHFTISYDWRPVII